MNDTLVTPLNELVPIEWRVRWPRALRLLPAVVRTRGLELSLVDALLVRWHEFGAHSADL
jgi:hypothetical protein